MKNLKSILLFLFVFAISLSNINGQSIADSLHLPEIVVTASSTREIIPSQKLTGEELKNLNSLSVADAVRYFSGVQIKDYGGIGGLKTVDIRSMGTNHMGIFYDGIKLGNAQNGQIDLGKYSLDNIESVSIYNGQKSEIFQSAKDFSSSGSIYLKTRYPHFKQGKTLNLRGIIRTGSFNLINPSLLWEQKLSSNIAASFNAELVNASGKYEYRYRRVHPVSHDVVYDTTAVRENGDVNSIRFETGIHGFIPSGSWNIRTYFYNSERGIPGAIVSNVWKRSQRQWDRSFFTQGSFRKSLSSKHDILINAKYANDYMRYLNPDTTLLYIDNLFSQEEIYLSMVNKYELLRNWDLSLATDWQWNGLQSDLVEFNPPTRNTTLIALASAADLGKVRLQGSIVGAFINDKINNTKVDNTIKEQFSPALFLTYKPFDSDNLNIRAFYKNSYRMPTFNDLYYTDVGNVELQPEYSFQYNLGATYGKKYRKGFVRNWDIKWDAYFNQITNKIIAVPKGNGMYRWMMTNLGYVEIKGIDLSASSTSVINNDWFLNLNLNYTYQQAVDLTIRTNKELEKITYGGQIAYIPWNSGSLIAGLQHRHWNLNYSFIYIGERYRSSANTPENYEQPWYTSDVSLSRSFTNSNFDFRVTLEVNNLLSQDYEVILNYPMPKRNYKLTLSVEI
ncbi:MAG: TonB-dependent receptor [Tissierellia bacterium]|nr:TonB-dependent receptor [Tissierellia bacterium]